MSSTNQPRVAYQGEPGAFSQTAARQLLGDKAATIPFRSFEEMFHAVETGDADCCVAPIENSLAGSIHRNYDLLLASGLTIRGETFLRIVHNLLAPPGTTLADVRRVYSHPVALAQCGRFLRQHPEMTSEPMHDTAGAVRVVMERRQPGEGAIASEAAANIYGGVILATNVEDDPQNFTRFFLLAPQSVSIRPIAEPAAQRSKTSLLLEIANTPGSLYRSLGVFATAGIDLSKIESRPIPGKPRDYAFYLDVIGNLSDIAIAQAIEQLREDADSVTVLGSYATSW
ncbi:MAG TPA: prephenate dehydratase [Thermoanaerobaculia bacterium]|jgi:prephenate dehydratase|nr:prephenate dehydratase [Thermoanaerobaculia bacterium]